jgi:hypothetical protein
MKKIPLLVVILSLTFLSAKCTTPPPTVKDLEQCSTKFKFNDIGEIVVEGSVCNCRMYRTAKDLVGSVPYTEEQLQKAREEDSTNQILVLDPKYITRKLAYCDTIVGWSNLKRTEPKSPYAIFTAFLDTFRLWLLAQ